MTKPRIPESLTAYLQEINLTIWACMYGHKYEDEFGERTTRPRADKSRVLVQLDGPGLEGSSPWGEGPTVGDAVRAAMANVRFRATRSGLDGALARLEEATSLCAITVLCKRQGYGDDIPF